MLVSQHIFANFEFYTVMCAVLNSTQPVSEAAAGTAGLAKHHIFATAGDRAGGVGIVREEKHIV